MFMMSGRTTSHRQKRIVRQRRTAADEGVRGEPWLGAGVPFTDQVHVLEKAHELRVVVAGEDM
jgi:hypothetical protein